MQLLKGGRRDPRWKCAWAWGVSFPAVPDEPVARRARDPDERQEPEPGDPADPARPPEPVVEEHLARVEDGREDRRVRGGAMERARERADPPRLGHDLFDRAVRGV